MANEEHLAILKQGVVAWNKWRAACPKITPDLRGANFSGMRFFEANFARAKLVEADLSAANLDRTNLESADLYGANLAGTRFSGANFFDAELSKTHLSGAQILGSNLYMASLYHADLSGTIFGLNSVAHVDLSTARGLESVSHSYSSSIGVDTLAQTLRGAGGRFTEEQLIFFEGAGVPHTLLEYLPGILETNPIEFFTCFISYSSADEDFVEGLN